MINSMNSDCPESPIDDAVFAWVRIFVSRPKSHYKNNNYRQGLKKNIPKYPKSGKDLDKIQRAIGDAAKIAKWLGDDARIAAWEIRRVFTEDAITPERVEVMMYNLEKHDFGLIDRVLAKVTEGHPTIFEKRLDNALEP